MRNPFLLLGGIGACIALASCTDLASPPSSRPERGGATPQYDVVGYRVNILAQSPGAPPLETYDLAFWVVQDEGARLEVYYQSTPTGVSSRFMKLVIDDETQLYRPDGSEVEDGDSVLITANIDLRQLLVTFEPEGLVFGDEPARLTMYWRNANLDVNSDGLVDELDSDIIRTLLSISYQSQPGAPWLRPRDQSKSLEGQYIRTRVYHFSRFAISW